MDVVGLYMDPPERAVVLCVDEKSQIQALERSQRSLPLKPGRAGTMTHDYKHKRHHHFVRGVGHRHGGRSSPIVGPVIATRSFWAF